MKGVTQSLQSYSHIRTAIYIVETDNSKKPPEVTLGSRLTYYDLMNNKLRVARR